MPYRPVVLASEFFERESEMPSGSRSSRKQTFDLKETIQRVFNKEDDNLGMPSKKDSDLDHQLYDMDDDQR